LGESPSILLISVVGMLTLKFVKFIHCPTHGTSRISCKALVVTSSVPVPCKSVPWTLILLYAIWNWMVRDWLSMTYEGWTPAPLLNEGSSLSVQE